MNIQGDPKSSRYRFGNKMFKNYKDEKNCESLFTF